MGTPNNKITMDTQLDKIKRFYYLKISLASEKLGICETLIKKSLRDRKIKRWPSRNIRSYINIIILIHMTGIKMISIPYCIDKINKLIEDPNTKCIENKSIMQKYSKIKRKIYEDADFGSNERYKQYESYLSQINIDDNFKINLPFIESGKKTQPTNITDQEIVPSRTMISGIVPNSYTNIVCITEELITRIDTAQILTSLALNPPINKVSLTHPKSNNSYNTEQFKKFKDGLPAIKYEKVSLFSD